MAGAAVIEVKGVTKAFGEREVLHGVDFDVAETGGAYTVTKIQKAK